MIISPEFSTILVLRFGDEIKDIIQLINKHYIFNNPSYSAIDKATVCRALNINLAQEFTPMRILLRDDGSIVVFKRIGPKGKKLLFATSGEIFC